MIALKTIPIYIGRYSSTAMFCWGANEQTDRLINNYRRIWTPTTPEKSQARYQPFKGVWAFGIPTHSAKHNASVVSRGISTVEPAHSC